MSGDLRWEFRRKDNDDDSSSDESKSSSEAVHKKHKLVSPLISVENDGENGAHGDGVEQKVKINDHTKVEPMSGKCRSVHSQRSRKDTSIHDGTERDSHEEGSRKKSKTSVYGPAVMDEIKKFRESLIEDLRLTRENLFHRMRQEMEKLVADDTLPPLEQREGNIHGKGLLVQHGEYVENTTSEVNKQVNKNRKFDESILIRHENKSRKDVMVPLQTNLEDNVFARHQNNLKERIQVQHQKNVELADDQVQCQNIFEIGMRAQNCYIGSLEGTAKSNATGCDDGYRILGEQVNNGQASRALMPTEKFGSLLKPNFQFCSTELNAQMQHQTNYLLGARPQHYSGRSLVSTLKGKERAQSNNCQSWIEYQVDCVRDVGPVASSEIERGARLTVPNESNFPSNVSSQVASSMYLLSPSVLTRPYGEDHILGTSSYRYIQPAVAGNRLGMNYDKANTMLQVNSHYGNFTGMSHQGRNGSIAHIGSRNVRYIDRQSIPSSSFGTGFSVATHQGMDSFPSQASMRYLPRDEKSIRDLRMNEGAKMFCGGSYAAPEGYVYNKFLCRSISKPQGTIQAIQRGDLEQGNMFKK